MLCTNCKMTRVANEAPCSHCGAPSPLLKISHDGSWGWDNQPAGAAPGVWNNGNQSNTAWNNNAGGSTGQAWGNNGGTGSGMSWNAAPDGGASGNAWNYQGGNTGVAADAGVPQLTFDRATTLPPTLNPGWSPEQSVPAPRPSQPLPPLAPQSQPHQTGQLALVPYQGGVATMPDGRQATTTLQLIPDQLVHQVLPALPDADVEELTYVPPAYTKPRPIIPKYRAISGMLSVVIVALLICGGVGYFVQSTGRLAGIQQFIAGKPEPPKVTQTAVNIQDPPNKVDLGPAANIIPSAALASRINPDTKQAIVDENEFKPGQKFYITFTVREQDTENTVSTKWYTNGQLLDTIPKKIPVEEYKGGDLTGFMEMIYPVAASGTVEIFWNDQFAQRLYFVVR